MLGLFSRTPLFFLLILIIIILLTDSLSKLMTKSLKVSFIQKRTGTSHRKCWTTFRTAVTEMKKSLVLGE